MADSVTEQHHKNLRKKQKFKEEVWRQDRKDRRAHMEFIAAANSEINMIHNILATRKNVGFFDSHKKELTLRVANAEERIYTSKNSMGKLDTRIEFMEKQLLD
jgi:hypothetical protein